MEEKQETKNQKHGCLIAFIIFAIIAAIGIAVYFIVPKLIKSSSTDSSYSTSATEIANDIKQATKAAPTLTAQASATTLTINVKCNDNYDLVEVTVNLINEKGNIIKTVTLQGRNYTKGNTYQVTYTFATLDEALNTDRYSYQTTKYV